jgi:choline dehydrogenase-like flavoprotein
MATNSYFQAGKPDTVLSMNTPSEYDAIVIGTGAGGGTLALHLAQARKNILILERGSLPAPGEAQLGYIGRFPGQSLSHQRDLAG